MPNKLTCQAVFKSIYAFSTCSALLFSIANSCGADQIEQIEKPKPVEQTEQLDAPITSEKTNRKAEALFKKGHEALDNKHIAVAERCYRKAIELEPHEARFHRQLALLLMKERRLPESERESRIDIAEDSQDWRGLVILGRILHMQRRYDEECEIYKKAIAILPPDQKQLKNDMENFIDTDSAAVTKQDEVKRLRKEAEEEQYKGLY